MKVVEGMYVVGSMVGGTYVVGKVRLALIIMAPIEPRDSCLSTTHIDGTLQKNVGAVIGVLGPFLNVPCPFFPCKTPRPNVNFSFS